MKRKGLTMLMLLLISSTAFAGYWAHAWDGSIPRHAWMVGTDTNQLPLYLCRGRYADGMQPGKLRRDFRGCHIAYGGKEIVLRRYQVYINRSQRYPRDHWTRQAWSFIPWHSGRTRQTEWSSFLKY